LAGTQQIVVATRQSAVVIDLRSNEHLAPEQTSITHADCTATDVTAETNATVYRVAENAT